MELTKIQTIVGDYKNLEISRVANEDNECAKETGKFNFFYCF